MAELKPNLNVTWNSDQTPVKPANLTNISYIDLGLEHLTAADVAIFSFIIKQNLEWNPNGIIRSVIGFTYPYVKQPVLNGRHLITRVYNTPAKKTYHMREHFNFRTTITQDPDKMNVLTQEARNDMIADHIAGVQLGEAQLMQYIFLKLFVSDAHIKKLGSCVCTTGAAGCCCGVIPRTLGIYEPDEGSTNGFPSHQNWRTLEEVVGNHETDGKFKDFGVESGTKLAPKAKLVKSSDLKTQLEAIRTELFTEPKVAIKFKTNRKVEQSNDETLNILGMFVTAIQLREDMCDASINGCYNIGSKCKQGAKCCEDPGCGCCIPRAYNMDDIVILANNSDYRTIKNSYIETKGFDNIEKLFDGGNLFLDSRLEPGKAIVLHKEAICIYPTLQNSGSADYPESGKRNTWFDLSMYIGHWPYYPAKVVTKAS